MLACSYSWPVGDHTARTRSALSRSVAASDGNKGFSTLQKAKFCVAIQSLGAMFLVSGT